MNTAQMDNIVSTTDLRKNTRSIIGAAQKEPQIIISNSKAAGVIISVRQFSDMKKISELYEDYMDNLAIDKAIASTKEEDYIDLDEALDELGYSNLKEGKDEIQSNITSKNIKKS